MSVAEAILASCPGLRAELMDKGILHVLINPYNVTDYGTSKQNHV